jgi:hypothetical protein
MRRAMDIRKRRPTVPIAVCIQRNCYPFEVAVYPMKLQLAVWNLSLWIFIGRKERIFE